MKTIGGWLLAGGLGMLLLMQGLSPYNPPNLDADSVLVFRDTIKGDTIYKTLPAKVITKYDTVYVTLVGDSLEVQVVQSDTVEVDSVVQVSAKFYADSIIEPRGFEFDIIG